MSRRPKNRSSSQVAQAPLKDATPLRPGGDTGASLGTLPQAASKPAKTPAKDGLASRDFLYVHSKIPERDAFGVIRSRQGQLEVGELRTMQDGQAITGEVVNLKPSQEHAQVFDIEVVADARPPASARATSAGPSQVASESYRDNWESIFGALGSLTESPGRGGPNTLN